MSIELLESLPRKGRHPGGAIVSAVLHAALVTLAVVATTQANPPLPATVPDTTMLHFPPAQEPFQPASRIGSSMASVGARSWVMPALMDVIPAGIPSLDLQLSDPSLSGPGSVVGSEILSVDGIPGGAGASEPSFAPVADRPAILLPGSPSPIYPEALRSVGIEGRVVAEFVIDSTGRAELITFRVVESAHELFTRAVRDALVRMRFAPAEALGVRVRSLARQEFRFELKK